MGDGFLKVARALFDFGFVFESVSGLPEFRREMR